MWADFFYRRFRRHHPISGFLFTLASGGKTGYRRPFLDDVGYGVVQPPGIFFAVLPYRRKNHANRFIRLFDKSDSHPRDRRCRRPGGT
jgi:hypothetical protein